MKTVAKDPTLNMRFVNVSGTKYEMQEKIDGAWETKNTTWISSNSEVDAYAFANNVFDSIHNEQLKSYDGIEENFEIWTYNAY